MEYVNTIVVNSIVFSLLTLSFILFPVVSFAQMIHGYPGKAAYNSSAEWPPVDGQCHWIPGGGSPTVDPPFTLVSNMSHTHVMIKGPVWGEVGGPGFTSFDIPINLKLFHTAGGIYNIGAILHGTTGDVELPLQTDVFPIIGDPSGLVSVNGHITLTPQDGVAFGVPLHGWFAIRVNTRTYFSNTGDQLNNETWIPLYSMIDPTVPEVNIAGYIQDKCTAIDLADGDPTPWQLNIVEIRQKLPLFGSFNNKQVTESFGYDYSPAPFPVSGFDLLLDADFHMGIAGTSIPTTFDTLAGSYNTLDPVQMSLSATPMGLLPNQHRLIYSWRVGSGPTGFDDPAGHVAANQESRALLSFIMTVGNNPDDSLAPTLWTVDSAAPVPVVTPPVIIPPVIVPPPLVWQVFVPTFRVNNLGQHQWCDATMCFDLP